MIAPFLASVLISAAVVTQDDEVFKVTSPNSGELKVSFTAEVFGESGLDAASFVLYCDSFTSLQSFSGTVSHGGSKPVRISKEDVTEYKGSSAGVVDDVVLYSFVPEGHFPMTVHYEYKVQYRKGFSSFPSFFPVAAGNTGVKSASYTLDVPDGYNIKYKYSGLEYSFSSEKGRSIHRWTLNDFAPVVSEDMMPPVSQIVPWLYASPEVINLGGYDGMQRNWQELGEWLYSIQNGTGELQPEEIERVRGITEGMDSTVDKLSVLYAYLRERTRYVSIQLGIGGLRPMIARDVSRTGFGDCKGLSNYLKALLEAVGVESDYYVINSDRSHLLPDYASVGQMNHAMLAVPLPEIADTAWVECTNPSYPLGYRHSGAAGHDVLLVKKEGGVFLRIPSYPDSLSLGRGIMDVTLSEDGSAGISARKELYLDFTEPYLSFRALSPERQAKIVTSGLKLTPDKVAINSVADNFGGYVSAGKDYIPEVDIDYSFVTRVYANVSGNRLFVPVNPVSSVLSVQKGERVNALFHDGARRMEYVIRVHLPDGFHPESMPDAVCLDSEWGTVSSSSSVSSDGKVVTFIQSVSVKPFSEPASKYDSFRNFARSANKLFSATLVLVKD